MVLTETFLHDWTGEIAAPLRLVENTVKPEWVDEYRHLNMAHYLTICDQANWAFWNWINAPEQTIEARLGQEYVIVENHVTYSGELAEGAGFSIETQLTDLDAKRFILFHRVLDGDGGLAATNEVKCLGFNLQTRRPEDWRPVVRERLEAISAAHAELGRPDQAGRGIALTKR
ncbi:MAG: thioesterase family protein [Paracoccaceae bacterium]|nr:thioesterase family protein [Paracoccaceae bacterium]